MRVKTEADRIEEAMTESECARPPMTDKTAAAREAVKALAGVADRRYAGSSRISALESTILAALDATPEEPVSQEGAPERIWGRVGTRGKWWSAGSWSTERNGPADEYAEYIRADVAEKRIEAALTSAVGDWKAHGRRDGFKEALETINVMSCTCSHKIRERAKALGLGEL